MSCHAPGISWRYGSAMDQLLVAGRLPALSARAARSAIVAALNRRNVTLRPLVNDAMLHFERSVDRLATESVRPALLFAERDRIVRELRGFIASRLGARLTALRRRDLVALGGAAAPFDGLVRGRRGLVYAVVIRRLPSDGKRLGLLRRIVQLAKEYEKTPLGGVLVYDLGSGSARLVRDSRTLRSAA